MKIVIATGLYPPEIGGPATHVRLLEKYLSKDAFELSVLPYGEVRHMGEPFRFFAYLYRLFKASKGAHALYALDPVHVGLPAYIVSKLRRIPLLLRLGGDYAWEEAQQRYGVTDPLRVFVDHVHTYPMPIQILSWCQRFVARRAAKVIVPSEHLKKIMYTFKVSKNRVVVLYSVFEPREIVENKEEIRKMFEYEGVVLFSAGRLVTWKGFRRLIDMVPLLEDSIGQPVTLVIAGEGPEFPALEAYAKENELTGKVRLVGGQPQETLLTAIKGADVFVLNAGYTGFAHQLLEVMHIGVPIVTTNVGVTPELITHEKEGLLVEYNDVQALTSATARILTHPELGTTLAQNARARVQEYTVDNMIEKMEVIFREYIPQSSETLKY